jgi:hypothetical protein
LRLSLKSFCGFARKMDYWIDIGLGLALMGRSLQDVRREELAVLSLLDYFAPAA